MYNLFLVIEENGSELARFPLGVAAGSVKVPDDASTIGVAPATASTLDKVTVSDPIGAYEDEVLRQVHLGTKLIGHLVETADGWLPRTLSNNHWVAPNGYVGEPVMSTPEQAVGALIARNQRKVAEAS